jgi:hypothetical protein
MSIRLHLKKAGMASAPELVVMVRSPGFEPGSSAWEADVLAKLDYDRNCTLKHAHIKLKLLSRKSNSNYYLLPSRKK